MLEKLFSLQARFGIYLFSQRRNFIPILSIYFLTLGDTTATQLGIYTGIGFLASFLLEVPSAYFADKFGHKKTLILSKILQGLSLIFFISASLIDSPYNYYIFILGSITQAFGFSFFSGTTSAYFHEILESQGKGKYFGKIMAKIRGKVSLVCAFVIVLLPYLTAIDIRLPLIINLIVDIIGLFILFTLPNVISSHKTKKLKNIFEIVKEAKVTKALHVSIFVGLIIGFLMGENAYRSIYLESLGYPIVLIGMVMGLSRIVWFIVGHYAYLIEKHFTMRKLFLFEVCLFPIFLIFIAYFKNPYIVGILLSTIIGYQHGRKSIIQGFILNDYLPDPKYKATVLSLESAVNSLTSMIVSFGAGFIMIHSYTIGYISLSITLFILLCINFYYIFRQRKTTA